jgi:hypothetical protein
LERGLNEQLKYVLASATHNIDGVLKDLAFVRSVASDFESDLNQGNADEDFEKVCRRIDDFVYELEYIKKYTTINMAELLGLQYETAACRKSKA